MNNEDIKNTCELYFSIVEDPRCESNVKHKLSDILIIVMCATLCGIDDLTTIVEYAQNKKSFF